MAEHPELADTLYGVVMRCFKTLERTPHNADMGEGLLFRAVCSTVMCVFEDKADAKRILERPGFTVSLIETIYRRDVTDHYKINTYQMLWIMIKDHYRTVYPQIKSMGKEKNLLFTKELERAVKDPQFHPHIKRLVPMIYKVYKDIDSLKNPEEQFMIMDMANAHIFKETRREDATYQLIRRDIAPTKLDCASCGAPRVKSRCSRCNGVVYCNRECQAAHWPVHKKECNQK